MIGIVMAGGRGSRMTAGRRGAGGGAAQGAIGPRAEGPGGHEEKLLLPIESHGGSGSGGKTRPVVSHVIGALAGAGIMEEIVVLASPANAPRTRAALKSAYADDPMVRIVDSGGLGYSKDLGDAMRAIMPDVQGCSGGSGNGSGKKCVMVVSGDMPLLDVHTVLRISDHHVAGTWTSILVSESYARMWDMSMEYGTAAADGTPCYYTGISMVGLDAYTPLDDLPRRHAILDDYRIAFTLNTITDYERLRGFGHP